MSQPPPAARARPPSAHDAARALLFPALLFLVVLVVCAAAGELFLRTLGVSAPNRFVFQDTAMFVPDEDPLLSYRLRPGYEGRTYNTPVTVGPQGLRDRALPRPKPDGEFRLLGLGDSFLFGIGAREQETLLRVLEEMLAPPSNYRTLRTINSGVPGYNTVQQRVWLERFGFELEPDAVLVLFCLNDPEGVRPLRADGWLDVSPTPPAFPALPEQHPIRAGRRWSHLVTLANKLAAGRSEDEAGRIYVDFYARGVFEDPPTGWQASQQALAEMKRLCEARGVAFFVVVCPVLDLLEDHPFTAAYERVAAACGRLGVPCFVPPLAPFREVPEGALRAHIEDGHFGPLGYRMLAESIAGYLRAHQAVWAATDAGVTAPADRPAR